MSRPRDNQCKRVYDAEDRCWLPERARARIPNDELQAYVDAVLNRRAFRSRWPHKEIDVELGRGGGSANYAGTVITLGTRGRNPMVVLHEIAHCLVPTGLYADHGPEFVGIYLFLVKMVLGQVCYERLSVSMREHRVRRSNLLVRRPRVNRRPIEVAA